MCLHRPTGGSVLVISGLMSFRFVTGVVRFNVIDKYILISILTNLVREIKSITRLGSMRGRTRPPPPPSPHPKKKKKRINVTGLTIA